MDIGYEDPLSCHHIWHLCMIWDEDHLILIFCVLGFENDGGLKSEGGPTPADCRQDHPSGT